MPTPPPPPPPPPPPSRGRRERFALSAVPVWGWLLIGAWVVLVCAYQGPKLQYALSSPAERAVYDWVADGRAGQSVAAIEDVIPPGPDGVTYLLVRRYDHNEYGATTSDVVIFRVGADNEVEGPPYERIGPRGTREAFRAWKAEALRERAAAR